MPSLVVRFTSESDELQKSRNSTTARRAAAKQHEWEIMEAAYKKATQQKQNSKESQWFHSRFTYPIIHTAANHEKEIEESKFDPGNSGLPEEH